MPVEHSQIIDFFKGKFLTDVSAFAEKFTAIRAFVFDWDGVFNNGIKDDNGSSAFSEIDAMGTNLLRFNHYLLTGKTPLVTIISGEKNKAAFSLANREHFDAVYYKAVHKIKALDHFCAKHSLQHKEVAFFFDDVLDFSVAKVCGLRIMVSRKSNPLLMEFVQNNSLADYMTAADGGTHAVREAVELLMGFSGKYDDTISQRMYFTETYQGYLQLRNKPQPVFYTSIESEITEQTIL
jgi:3-deoxy-D-manno-octulosonate 8-phosphate phosphatase (KDO 8-P phosphatase)